MHQLEVIEYSDKRVLTTQQLAESFNSNSKIINRNFQRNRDHYIVGVHYFALTGDVLKEFKGQRQNDVTLKFTSTLYLWTEKGAWLHAKSINNDKAWEAYKMLIDNYYAVVKQINNAQKPLMITHEQLEKLERRVESLEEQLKQVTLHSGEQIRLRRAVGERVSQLSKSQPSSRQLLFRSLYSDIKARYAVGSYRDVKQHKLQDCLRFVSNWRCERK